MKRKLLLAFFGIAICGTALQAQTLDEAILNAAFAISRDLPASATVAVVNVRSDSGKMSEYALNELYGAILRNHKVVPIKPNESQLQTIRELNAGSVPNSEAASSLAQLLKVQYLVTGSITGSGSVYRLQFTAVDQNGNQQSQYGASLNPYNDSQLASLLGGSYSAVALGVPQKKQKAPKVPKEKKPIDPEDTKLWTVGASLGTSLPFTAPCLIGTVHGTLAPFRSSFFDLGMDMGGGALWEDFKYFSLYPFANYAFFVPFRGKGGWYIGTGLGVMIAKYTFESEGPIWDAAFAVNVVTGFNIGDFMDVSYTLRTDFGSLNGKLSLGYTYRFK